MAKNLEGFLDWEQKHHTTKWNPGIDAPTTIKHLAYFVIGEEKLNTQRNYDILLPSGFVHEDRQLRIVCGQNRLRDQSLFFVTDEGYEVKIREGYRLRPRS